MRIAHFSDLHLCEEAGGDAQLEKCLEWVDVALELGAEHLVFTGDFVDYANLEDASLLFRHLESIADVDNITVVPGNHDIFPVGHFRQNLLTGDAEENFQSFTRRARHFLSKQERVWSNCAWPFIRRLSKDVVLVALDTTHRQSTGRLQSGVGELDEGDAEEILECLESHHQGCQWRVLAMHHWPFGWKQGGGDFWPVAPLFDVNFTDLPAVRRFIQAGRFDVVLCGHQHAFEQRRLGSAQVVLSGSGWEQTEAGVDFEVGFHLVELGRSIRITEHGEQATLLV